MSVLNMKVEPERPSPGALLAAAAGEQRGRLRLFLGAAPGVGKTYAMLEAARAKKREGVDIVVGVAETHGRAETDALLNGLEVIPRRQIEYRERAFPEMDLDALLARRPDLALVDELAHSNVPGSRHPKRYLDVEEILAAGIDVYTTLNIQHLESLNDAVAQITGIRVSETVPDRFVESAAEVEVVDITPEELLERLRQGKVYVPEQAESAVHNYFRRGNLTALRELALRRTAERVDAQMQAYMQERAIPGPWPAAESIMVCVSESPLSPHLVRAARRMADRRHAVWLAVYVETPHHYRLSEAERDRIAQALHLAEQLGGEAVTIPGQDVADDLMAYARKRNVTEVIVGKSIYPRWAELWRGSLVQEIIRKSDQIDVYVITGEEEAAKKPQRVATVDRPAFSLGAYLGGAVAVACSAVAARVIQALLSSADLAMAFLPAVLFSAVMWGRWPAILTAILSVLVYDFFFVLPFYTFTIASPEDILALIMFLTVAVLISNLTARIQAHADVLQRREKRTATLYALSQQLARAPGLDEVVQAIASQVSEVLGVKTAVLLPALSGLEVKASQPPGETLNSHEWAASMWVWQHNQPAGPGTETLPGSERMYIPLTTARGTLGVLGLRADGAGGGPSPDQRRLLQALADQAALAIERARLVQEMAEARSLAETERLRTALLSSISHDLRTPLSSITGAVTSLLSFGSGFDEAERKDLLLTIQEEAARLDHFVGNLLDMTRLESGALQLKREWVEIGDIIGSALARQEHQLSNHRVSVQIEPGLPLLWLDFVLMEQVFVNLLDNASRYSEAGTAIHVQAQRAGGTVTIDVADEGVGVPVRDLERIFDKFYRVQRGDRQVAGTGLGLSICRGLVEAHGGKIRARLSARGKGTVFTVAFPVQKSPTVVEEREGADG
jgi:two-component system, OmpR family, sensor histidine kinase KdpD